MMVREKMHELEAFMELNESYLKSFIALITAREASSRRFTKFMAPSI
jgi:hypothetical protein